MKEIINFKKVMFIGIALLFIGYPIDNALGSGKPEGTLIAALPTLATEGFLPDRVSSTASPLWECVYDYMIYSDNSTLKPKAGVIESWQYTNDYRTLTLSLRKGILFHNGWGELTAEDVKWTIEFNRRKNSTNPRGKALKEIKNMEVKDPYTLVLNLKDPDPIFWITFCTSDNASLPVLCKKYIESVGEEKANREPIGSGPYRLVEHRLGDYAKFEAIEKHWLVIPEFKYLIIRVIPEETTRIAMIRTGEVDIAMELSIDKYNELQKAGLRTIVSKNSNAIFFPFGGMLLPEDKRYVAGRDRKDPWADVKVREAMNIAIDRASIVKNLYHGSATPSPTWVTIPGWDKLEQIPYDPIRAKQLLSEAGYPNGFSFKFITYVKDPLLPLIAETAAGYWEAIGLKAEIIRSDYATWRSRNKVGKTAGHIWTHVLPIRPDWTARLANYELPGASSPFFQSEETKSIINKIQQELDPQKREALYNELAQLYRSIYPHIPIVFSPRLHATGKNVGEWYPSSVLYPKNFAFARHSKPLNTWRLFTP